MNRHKRFVYGSRQGSVLVTALLMIAVAVIAATSAVRYCLHEWGLSKHSSSRTQALYTAEAGVEVAMAAFNLQYSSSVDSWADWTLVSNGVYELTYNMVDMPEQANWASAFSVVADTNALTITSSASADVSRLANPAARAVFVTLEPSEKTSRSPFEFGLLSKDELRIVGNPYCDSYNSTNGPYGGANISINCDIGSMGVRPDAISGGGAAQVFGDAALGPDGGVVAHPAPFWTGTLSNDLDVDFPDVIPPRTDLTRGAINSTETLNVVGDDYVGVPSVDLSNKSLTIAGNGELTLYVAGDFSVNTPSDVTFSPAAGGNITVKLFLNGAANIKGELNTGGYPINLQVYGTDNCNDIYSQANNMKSMAIYAPYADIELAGNATIQGAVVGSTIRVTGTFDFHYDEALSDLVLPVDDTKPITYDLKTWWEL